AFPFFGALGALHWRNKHDVLHHGHPNVHQHDPDIGLWPMTSCQEDHLKSNALRRWIQKRQGYFFWPLTMLLPFMMRISSMKRLVTHAKTRGFEGVWWSDLLCQIAHYAVFLVVPTILWGGAAIAVYFAVWALVGVSLALIFAPAHMGLPIVHE